MNTIALWIGWAVMALSGFSVLVWIFGEVMLNPICSRLRNMKLYPEFMVFWMKRHGATSDYVRHRQEIIESYHKRLVEIGRLADEDEGDDSISTMEELEDQLEIEDDNGGYHGQS